MRVRLTATAERNIEAIVAYIGGRDAAAAERVHRVTVRAAAGLGEFPLLGRLGRMHNTRERLLTRYPYLLVYRIYGDQVFVLRVRHQHQQWPAEEQRNT